jgi:uncharacterized Zn-binding protein involved in type VI secretion
MVLRLYGLILIIVLAACANQNSTATNNSGNDAAAEVVERYLTAKVAGDEQALRGLLCAEMESELARETRSFAGVEGARIEGMECTANGETVTCSGEILATYGTEEQSFPLGSYSVVQEDGEWKWCGEAG